MTLKTFNPTTPSRRELVLVDRSALWKGKPVKELTEGLKKKGGRNNTGRITADHRGGGHKRSRAAQRHGSLTSRPCLWLPPLLPGCSACLRGPGSRRIRLALRRASS